MKKKNKINAGILIIGNEILSGRTKKKRLFISNWLNLKCGISVRGRIIPDEEKIIIKNILSFPKNLTMSLQPEELDLRTMISLLNQSQKHLK